MLSNAYFVVKFRFDTDENEPAKICKIFPKNANPVPDEGLRRGQVERRIHLHKPRTARARNRGSPSLEVEKVHRKKASFRLLRGQAQQSDIETTLPGDIRRFSLIRKTPRDNLYTVDLLRLRFSAHHLLASVSDCDVFKF